MKTNKLLKGLYTSAAVLMLLSPIASPVLSFAAGDGTGTTDTQTTEPKDSTEDAQKIQKASDIKDDAPLNINIYKYATVAGTGANEIIKDPTVKQEAPDATKYRPVENVMFEVTQVKPADGKTTLEIDPNTPSTYQAVANTNVDGQTFKTDADGHVLVNVGNYKENKGIYLIKEVKSPGVEVSTQNSLIQMPMAFGTGADKAYSADVSIYPKNKFDETTTPEKLKENTSKVINGEKSNIELGGTITWDISYKQLPKDLYVEAKDGTPIYAKLFQFVDPLDKNLSINENTDIEGTVFANDLDTKGSPIDKADYTVTKDEDNKVTITLTEKGMENLQGKKVTFTLKAKVEKIEQENGVVKDVQNTVTTQYTPATGGIDPENPDKPGEGTTDPKKPEDPKKPDEGNTAQFNQIDIKKVDGADGKVLAGAKFAVYTKNDKGEYEAVKTVDKAMQNSETEKDGVLTLKTDENGLGHVYGLNPAETYYVKEVEAPKGYDLPKDEYIKVDAVAGDNAAAIDAEITNNVDPIQNFIPMTGSQRRIAVMLIGGTLAVGSMIYVYVQKKRKDEEAEA